MMLICYDENVYPLSCKQMTHPDGSKPARALHTTTTATGKQTKGIAAVYVTAEKMQLPNIHQQRLTIQQS